MQPPRCGPGAEPEPWPGQHQRRSAEPRAAGLLQALLPHLAPLQALLQDQPALQAGHLLPLQRPPDGHDKQPGYVLRQNLKHCIWISFYQLPKNFATLDIVLLDIYKYRWQKQVIRVECYSFYSELNVNTKYFHIKCADIFYFNPDSIGFDVPSSLCGCRHFLLFLFEQNPQFLQLQLRNLLFTFSFDNKG